MVAHGLPATGAILAGVILTLQGLSLHNVFATLTNDRENNNSADGSSAAASWSLSLDSFSLSPGSLLRLVSSRVVLVDCRVSEQLFQAAAAAQGAAVNVTQVRTAVQGGQQARAAECCVLCQCGQLEPKLVR